MKNRWVTMCVLGFLAATNIICAQTSKPIKLKPIKFISVEVEEPSDIAIAPTNESYYIVSDNGYLFETDLLGKIIRKADYFGLDCEAVTIHNNQVFVAEEMSRKIRVFNIDDLSLQSTFTLPYSGGRNKGYEAMTYNHAKSCFVIITEKDPVYLFELNADFSVINELDLSSLARDISAATWHDDSLWLLSDEDMQVIRLNPNTYKEEGRWYIPVINPEGIAFNKQGQMLIVADDMQRLYYFEIQAQP